MNRWRIQALKFPTQDIALVISALKTVHRVPIIPQNSTVLGRRANANHDAREWFDGWINLGLTDPRVYADGVSNGASVACGIRLGVGQYLHVPLINVENGDHRWYRVRCRIEPGDVLKVSRANAYVKIIDVRPEKLQDLTEREALAEGSVQWGIEFDDLIPELRSLVRELFVSGWDARHKSPYRWSDNPWVWRYEFMALREAGETMEAQLTGPAGMWPTSRHLVQG